MTRKNTISVLILMIAIALLLTTGFVEAQVNASQLPIDPKSIPQFVDPLPHFAGLRVDAKAGGNLTVKMVPHQQIALSTGTPVAGGIIGGVIDPVFNPDLGQANVWVYRISNDGVNFTPPLWPAFTIEAYRGNPLEVTYLNELDGSYADVNIIVDQTLHWANPAATADPYSGSIPAVVHLHGGEVPSESDGGPDAWFTYNNLTGPSWGIDGTDNVYSYANTQEAATLWFHDHALGVTRLNVYAGMAGFYFLRGPEEEALHLPGWSGDDLVQEIAPAGASGVFNPDPYLPELEVVIQDRMFDTKGGLYFPNLPPNPAEHPFWTPEFVGDIITVNGKTWPYISVAPRKYRVRFLNGSNARFYELWLQDLPTKVRGPVINQIGTDGGLLDVPVAIDPNSPTFPKLIMGPGERADVIIDFGSVANPNPAVPYAVWTLKNSGNTPYPGGEPPMGSTLGRIMQFIVNGLMVDGPDADAVGGDNSQLPAALRSAPGLVKLSNFAGGTTVTPDSIRQLTLNEVMAAGGPLEVLVNNTKWDGNGMENPGLGETEIPTEGTTELWQIINITADAHPIHLHLVQFQLVSRQKFNMNKYLKAYDQAFGGAFIGAAGPPLPYHTPNADGALGGNPAIIPYLQGPAKPANANEQGWKDTFIMYPGEVTTVVVRWAPTDLPITTPQEDLLFAFDPSLGPGYVWHCHIIDHEDNEMMRPYRVIANASRTSAFVAENSMKNGSIIELGTNLPTEYSLSQNYPNPFNPTTQIAFTLPEAQHVILKVFNSRGQEIATLIDGEAPAGYHTALLNASDMATGMYYYKLIAGNFVQTKKMLLIK